MPFESLIAMYEAKPAARKLFDAIHEDGVEHNRTTVDELIQSGDVSRRQAITLLRDLEEAGYGEFKVGRKGHPSRLEWREDPRALAERVLNGELDPFAAPGETAEPSVDQVAEPPVDQAAEPSVDQAAAAPIQDVAASDPSDSSRRPTPSPERRPADRELVLEMFPAAGAEPAPRQGSAPHRPRPVRDPGTRNLGLIEHSYVLRRGLRVVVELPEDLSAREAEILAAWVRNLSFER